MLQPLLSALQGSQGFGLQLKTLAARLMANHDQPASILLPGGIDPRNLCEDAHGLKVFDRKLVQKLGKPSDLASYTAVVSSTFFFSIGFKPGICRVLGKACSLFCWSGARVVP
eukprot:1160956-Pelagomonas_calceolata.AAC.7